MSSSESFGIVLLEAWLAGKPVIANCHCAAFHDVAVHGVNALLVSPEEVAEAIRQLSQDVAMAAMLANNGRHQVRTFDWNVVTSQFVETCLGLLE